MRAIRLASVLRVSMGVGFLVLAGRSNLPQPFVGYDYVRPVRRFLTANTSPYDDLTNKSVYDSAPANIVIPEPTGTLEEPDAFSHYFSQSEPDLGAPPDIFGPQHTKSK